MSGKKYDVFLSHHSADKPAVEILAQKLLDEDVKLFFDKWNLIPGTPWQEEIEEALAQSETCVVFQGPHGPGTWENEEMRAALARRASGGMLRVFAVFLPGSLPDKADLPPFLKRFTWVDFRSDLEDSDAFWRLLCGIRGEEPGPPRSRANPKSLLQGPITHFNQGFKPLAGATPFQNLPYAYLGDLFTGRQEELAALDGDKATAITQSAAISGLGGIGKTCLAVEYAWRTAGRHTAIWFVRADSPENLLRNLAALGGPELLHLPEWEHQTEDVRVVAVKRWFREHPGWLMIVDNVDTPDAADAVLKILPSLLSTGRVLITSRLANWPPSVQTQPLETLSIEEAARFLLNRTYNGREVAEDDEYQAASLAAALDGLPIALELAAAFIRRHRMRFLDYLQAWEREPSTLLNWHDKIVIPNPVAKTWQHTFHQLSSKAAALLRLMAFLASDPIPVDMFEQRSRYVEEAAQRLHEESGKRLDELSIANAFDELADYSMISRQDRKMVTVHRMVQESMRAQIIEKDRNSWISVMLHIIDVAPTGDTSDAHTLARWNQLRPHVAEIVRLGDKAGIVNPTIRLMSDLGQHLRVKALYSEAEPWMRRALAIAEEALGPGNHRVAVQHGNLARLLLAINRLDDAEEHMRRALEIDETTLGKDDWEVATDLNNLALVLQSKGLLKQAEPLMRRALDIDKASFGPEQPRVARDLVNLARLLQAMNCLEALTGNSLCS